MTTGTQPEIRAKVRAALKDGRHDEAKTLLAAALDRWPDAYSMLMLRAEVLAASGDITAALEDFHATRVRFGDKDGAALGLLRLLIEHDRLSEARTVFESAVWSSALPDDHKAKLITVLSPQRGDLDETEYFLQRLLSTSPGNYTALTRIAVIRWRQGRWNEAVRIFDELALLGPLPEYAQAIQADVLYALARFPEALALARELATAYPHRVDHTNRLLIALGACGFHHEAAVILKEAAAKWPGDWRLQLRLNRCVPVSPLWEETFAVFEGGFSAVGADGRALFQFALASLRQGKTEQSLSALDEIVQKNLAGADLATPFQRVLKTLSPEEWRGRMRLADDQAAEVQIVDVDGADTTIIVFSGVEFGFSYLPFGYADVLFSAYRANMIYLRDFKCRAYFEGISSLAPTAGQTVDRLRNMLEKLGTRRLITIGNSVGGFVAIRYGSRLGAQAAISFGAPTTLEEDFQADSSPGIGYTPKALKRVLSFRLSEEKDLVKDLVESASMRVFCHYAAQYPAEVAHANRIRGLRNVELRPLNISDHSVANYALAHGILDRVLVEEVGVPRK